MKFKVNKEDKAKEKRQIRFLIAVKYTSSCSIVSHNAKHLKLCSNNTYILFQRERKKSKLLTLPCGNLQLPISNVDQKKLNNQLSHSQ